MKKIKVAIIGSGGHAKSCIDVIENIKTIKIIGIIDNKKKAGIGKYKVICDDKNRSYDRGLGVLFCKGLLSGNSSGQ